MTSERHDPIEDDPRFQNVLARADREAEEALAKEPRELGFCRIFWATKKRILRERFGIDWKSPAEMNPHIIYD